MNSRRVALLVIFCFILFTLIAPLSTLAQGTPLVAFINSSGQLVISSGDGSYRWIVTNPGETLEGDTTWSPSGDQLFFAVSVGGDISLRAASPAQQSVSEIGRTIGSVLALSPDGNFIFYQQDDGTYGIGSPGGTAFTLPISNDFGARYSGLWMNNLPLVAYWGYAGNSALAVTNAATQQTLTLDSGRSAPITPLLWQPNSTELIYRDATGVVQTADLACFQAACSTNPLESAIPLASADADVATDESQLYFRSGSSIAAVDLNCAAANNCADSAFVIAENAAPQTPLNAANGTLVYTAYAQNANDPNDREVRVLDLACISGGSCAPQTLATNAIAGSAAANGQYAVIESGNGLESLDLSSGARAYLSDRGAALTQAHWQP